MAERKSEALVPAEEVDSRLAQILRVAEEQALSLRETAPREFLEQEPSELPDVEERLIARLRHRLIDSMKVATPTHGEDGIDPAERQHEISKKALDRLRAVELRGIARELGLTTEQRKDALISTIAEACRDDERTIAWLVLRHQEAKPETGIADRLFPMHESIDDLRTLRERLDVLVRRYIRIGLAKWFIFEEADVSQQHMRLSGLLRAYRVNAVQEAEAVRLGSLASASPATLTMGVQDTIARVRASGVTESRAILDAFEAAAGAGRESALGVSVEARSGELMGWDPRSVFLVDFLDRHLSGPPVQIWNLTTARFQMERQNGRTPAGRPTVKAVTLEGQHLLSSRAACEHVTAGRGLVSISFQARASEWSQDLLPVHIELARDHATVVTGFGGADPRAATGLQRWLVQKLRASLQTSVAETSRLREVARQIRARAQADEPPRRADIFAPDEEK